MAARHSISSDEGMQKLKEGNGRYVEDKILKPSINSLQRYELTTGQNPFAIILNCADSRVVPELIFDRGIGDLFVIRVAGNIANPSSIASIEYAVEHIGTNLIVVLGHESCGAVGAAIASYPDGDNGPNLNHLISFINPAVKAKPGAPIKEVVECNAAINATALISNSDIIRKYVDSGDLKVVPAYYGFTSGKVDFLNEK
jgi:carbonic anhydrase